MQRLFEYASSIILTNITIDAIKCLNKLEVNCCGLLLMANFPLVSSLRQLYSCLISLFCCTHVATVLCIPWQLYPCRIPDLSSGSPLILSGRYHGGFPDSVKASGSLADSCSFVLNLRVQKTKDFPLDKVISQVLKLIISQRTSYYWLIDYIFYILILI